jgi:hypothetical protein
VPHARRATVLAAALATGAETLVMEDPLGGLPEEAAQAYGPIAMTALEGKAWIALCPRAGLTSPLTLAADEIVLASASSVDAQGTARELAAAARTFALRVDADADALAALASSLADRSVGVRSDGARVVVDLGDKLTTAELLGLCDASRVFVIELYPVARALA